MTGISILFKRKNAIPASLLAIISLLCGAILCAVIQDMTTNIKALKFETSIGNFKFHKLLSAFCGNAILELIWKFCTIIYPVK